MNMFTKVRKTAAGLMAAAIMIGSAYGGAAPHQVSAASVAAGPQDPKEIEQFADAFFSRPDIKDQMAGAVIVVTKGDQILLKKGYGYANVEEKLPVDPDQTVFRIASISKVITSTAVMQLVDQGKLDLNKELNNYLGDVQISNQTKVPLTMKHLLMNSTGFDYGDSSELSTNDLTIEVPLKQYVLDNTPVVVRNPGDLYRYDNNGFTLQGYAVEQVSGQSFGAYVKEHIFEPLGMKSSDFRLTPALAKRLAVTYDPLGEVIPPYATVPTELPAGGMLSTGTDMAKFMMAHLGSGKLGDARILSEESATDMHSPQLGIHAKLPNMAYGFEYSGQHLYNGHYVVEKGGDYFGFHSGMWLIPVDEIGIYVAVNRDQEIRGPLIEAFMDHYYPEVDAAEPVQSSTQSLIKLEGIYGDLRNRLWTTRIHAQDGKLIVSNPMGEHILSEIEPLLFQDEQGIRAGFKLNDQDEVQAFYYDMKPDSWGEKLVDPPVYQDVSESSPYAEHIYRLRQLDVYDDSGKQAFHPEQTISREMFIGWIVRWLGVAPSKQKSVFTDTLSSPYAGEIQAAYEFGLISGGSNGLFQPQRPLTRQEAATIVWRLANGVLYAQPEETQLAGETDIWAIEGVQYVVAKVLYGPEVTANAKGAMDYRSKQPMLKQEAAALIAKLADNLF